MNVAKLQRKLRKGLRILSKYMPDGQSCPVIDGKDCFYAGPKGLEVSEFDKKALEADGWFWDEAAEKWMILA